MMAVAQRPSRAVHGSTVATSGHTASQHTAGKQYQACTPNSLPCFLSLFALSSPSGVCFNVK